MASSNRHWPSMFKSKPCNPHHQWQQHDPIPNSCTRSSSYSSVGGNEERSPEPKPRWNPKPEQIKILEAIFNSGMVNPPRDEIRRIRAQLQEYGQVGDANVFYWFQNRKSRSKNKLRHLQTTSKPPSSSSYAAPSSSSSSSDKNSPKTNFLELTNSPTSSVNQTAVFNDLLAEPFLFPAQGQQPNQCFMFSELANMVQPLQTEPVVGPCTSLLLSEIMNKKDYQSGLRTQLNLNYQNISTTCGDNCTVPSCTKSTAVSDTVTVPSFLTSAQAAAADSGGAPGGTIVFINDVAVDVGVGPFNVREAFGDDGVLINSAGQPILTNEWGVTVQSLQNGAFYYLVRTLSPFSL